MRRTAAARRGGGRVSRPTSRAGRAGAEAGRYVEADGAGGPVMASHRQRGCTAARARTYRSGGVEPDHGVEVDDAAGLVFGDLDVADAEVARSCLRMTPAEPGARCRGRYVVNRRHRRRAWRLNRNAAS